MAPVNRKSAILNGSISVPGGGSLPLTLRAQGNRRFICSAIYGVITSDAAAKLVKVKITPKNGEALSSEPVPFNLIAGTAGFPFVLDTEISLGSGEEIQVEFSNGDVVTADAHLAFVGRYEA